MLAQFFSYKWQLTQTLLITGVNQVPAKVEATMKSQIICALAFTLFLIFLILFIPLFIISENFQDLNTLEDLASKYLEDETSEQEWETDENDMITGMCAPLLIESKYYS